jgi:hypothetical protein
MIVDRKTRKKHQESWINDVEKNECFSPAGNRIFLKFNPFLINILILTTP